MNHYRSCKPGVVRFPCLLARIFFAPVKSWQFRLATRKLGSNLPKAASAAGWISFTLVFQQRADSPGGCWISASQPGYEIYESAGCKSRRLMIVWCWARHLSQSFHGCIPGSLVHVLKPLAQCPHKTHMVGCYHRISLSPLLARFWSTERPACRTDESQCFSFSWAYTTRGSCERYVQAISPLHHSPRRENHLQPLWTRRHCRLSDILSDVSVQKLHPAASASKSPQKNQERSRINPT
jgi:hypothetical protein